MGNLQLNYITTLNRRKEKELEQFCQRFCKGHHWCAVCVPDGNDFYCCLRTENNNYCGWRSSMPISSNKYEFNPLKIVKYIEESDLSENK